MVVEVSAAAGGLLGGAVFVISSSGTVFTGPMVGAGTPGSGINARAGYINPSDDDYSGEQVDDFINGVALSGSVTIPPASAALSFPVMPLEPFAAGRSATEFGLGAMPGADLSLVWMRPTGAEMPAWADD